MITEKHLGFAKAEILNEVKVQRTGFAALKSFFLKNRRGVARQGGVSQKEEFASKINRLIIKHLYFPDDSFIWYFSALVEAKKILEAEKTNVLITSSLPFTSHLIGLNLKKQYPGLLWIADSGDPFSFQTEAPLNNHFLYGRLNRHFEKQVVNCADWLTVTSVNTRQKYLEFFPEAGDKIKVIPPLLSERTKGNLNKHGAQVESTAGKKIKLGYFGKFYDKIREPQQLTVFISQLFLAKPEFAEKVEIHIYGDIFPQFRPELAKIDQVILHGLIPREQVGEEMHNMDLLLNISNITDYQLPSKAPDYLNSGKAILNIYTHDRDEFRQFFTNYPFIYHYLIGSEIDDQLLHFIDTAGQTKVSDEWIREHTLMYREDAITTAYEALFIDRK